MAKIVVHLCLYAISSPMVQAQAVFSGVLIDERSEIATVLAWA